MTRSQMHSELKFLLDKVDSSAAPLFLTDEMDRLLNISQEKFIAKRAFGNNPRRTTFEEDQKRRDDLRTIVGNTVITNFSTSEHSKPNSVLITLPADYRHSVNEEVVFVNGERVGVKPITHDRYNKIIDDPFNKPHKNTVYRLDYGGDGDTNIAYVELITANLADSTILEYHLRYIENPPQIGADQDCVLADHTHREIVRMAVVEALEGIESPRYQSSKIELNEIE